MRFSTKTTICVLAIGGVLVLGTSASADIINVPDDQPTIQAGIDAASDGDEVVVAPGTYLENIDFLGKAVTLRSSDGPDVTTIDATGLDTSVVKCVNAEGPDTVLHGFTITGGAGTAIGGGRFGGGMLNWHDATPTVTNCTFSGNSAVWGGGIANIEGGCPTVASCTFNGNTATAAGGGMYSVGACSPSPMVANCTFNGNTAKGYGGGMFNVSNSLTVRNCTFNGNSVNNWSGGGMYSTNASNVTVIGCTFTGNASTGAGGAGGGMGLANTSLTVINCTFTANTSVTFSGGIYVNQDSTLAVHNSILWGDSPDEVVGVGAAVITVSYSDVQGGWTGTANINTDPMFVDTLGEDGITGTADDNLRLEPGSPCIDAGLSVAIPLDLDGNQRIVDDPATIDTGIGFPSVIDMGAYEFGSFPACPADFDGDGAVGASDLAQLLGSWGPCP